MPRVFSPVSGLCCKSGSLGLSSIIRRDDLAAATATQCGPCPEPDRLLDESNRTVAKQDVGPARVQGVHLVGIANGAVGRVDDRGGLIDRRPAIGPDVTARPVPVRVGELAI